VYRTGLQHYTLVKFLCTSNHILPWLLLFLLQKVCVFKAMGDRKREVEELNALLRQFPAESATWQELGDTYLALCDLPVRDSSVLFCIMHSCAVRGDLKLIFCTSRVAWCVTVRHAIPVSLLTLHTPLTLHCCAGGGALLRGGRATEPYLRAPSCAPGRRVLLPR
jgi:hypothetical protein